MAQSNVIRMLKFSVAFLLGALAGGFGVHYFYKQILDYSVQMDSASDATIYVATLKQIRSGHPDKANELLETFLSGAELILNSCEMSDCAKSHQTLQLIEQYKREFNAKP